MQLIPIPYGSRGKHVNHSDGSSVTLNYRYGLAGDRQPKTAKVAAMRRQGCAGIAYFYRIFMNYTRERKHFLCMREDYCRKARKD